MYKMWEYQEKVPQKTVRCDAVFLEAVRKTLLTKSICVL